MHTGCFGVTAMARVILLGLALLLSNLAGAKDFTGPEASFEPGFWYNPDDSGWGIDMHLAGDRLVAGWATFTSAGEPTWVLGIGELDGDVWRLELKRHRWNVDADEHAGGEVVGQLSVTFGGRETAELTWTLDGVTGASPIEPLIVDLTRTAEDYSGLWIAPELPGAGLSVHSQGPLQLLIAYFYDREGEPRWAFGTNNGDPAQSRVPMKAYRRGCPGCTNNITAENAVIGDVDIVFDRENRGAYGVSFNPEDTNIVNVDWRRPAAELRLLTDLSSARAHDSALAPFSSEASLTEFLRQGLRLRFGFPYRDTASDYSPVPAAPTSERSNTNLQVAGVDEADVIKSDGNLLYSLWPLPDEEKRHVVRIGAIDDGSYQELSRLRFGDVSLGALSGLYVLERTNSAPETLVVVSGGSSNVWFSQDFCVGPWFYTDSEVQVHLFDVSDPADPQLMHELALDGSLAESRRIDDRLFLVTRFASSDAALQRLEGESRLAAIRDSSLTDMAPTIRVDGGDPEVLLDPSRTLLPPLPPGARPAQFTSVIEIDLRNPTAFPATVAIAAESQAIHVTADSLWVATNSQLYDVAFAESRVDYDQPMRTDIHRFRLSQSGPVYAGTGAVDGHMGWGLTDTLRNFRLSQSGEQIRIVTSQGHGWNPSKQHMISILDADVDSIDDPFALTAQLPNDARPEPIGKPGENLHGVRYVDDRAYLVTFKRTDPLYVVDLSNASDPQIAGELEVTGFSDYLHPLPNNLLLGFGKEAVPADNSGDSQFVWFQGLQLSLFDVRDPSRPELLDRVDIGRRGSESSLMQHHGAFALQPANASRPTRVAIPVVVHDGEAQDDPTYNYAWQQTGSAMFDVDTDTRTLELRGILSAFERDRDGERNAWPDSQALAARTLIVGDDTYFYLNGEIWTGLWGQDGPGDGPQ